MMLDKSIETGNGQAVPSEITVQPDAMPSDDRLTRLQAALSSVAQIQQMVGVETSSADPSLSVEDKAKRLAAALSIVSDNYSVLEQAANDSSDDADIVQGAKLDNVQTALVLTHMKLASHLARRYTNRGEPFDDLQQVAAIGLIKSVIRFDPERGYEFSTFANVTIEGELKRHFRDKTWSVHVPRKAQETGLSIPKVREALEHRNKRPPTTAEISAELEIDEGTVLEAIMIQKAYKPVSLDAFARADDRTTTSLGDTKAQEGDDYEKVDNKMLAEELLAYLEPREALILRARSGMPPFDREYSQTEIADMIGISQMHVSRLCEQALVKLSKLLPGDEAII